ncbi:MAG: Fic family protein [Nitrospirae bacterium]|nr:Fic family protein [Nitrospirota bacterium]
MKHSPKYDTSSLLEAQFEPGSRGLVLRNKLGIKSRKEMNEVESIALKAAMDELVGIFDNKHRFTTADIRTMHKIWLEDIYEWAGEYRQVNISKGDFHFAAAVQVLKLMAEFEKGALRKWTPCNFKEIEQVSQASAEVHVELVLIHPFREGNGRVARMLSTLMAFQSGLPMLNFKDLTGGKRKDYFAAINSGLNRDYQLMEMLFAKIIRRTLKTKSADL